MLLDKLVELIERGFLGQAVLATIVWGTIAYLAASGQPVPEFLIGAGTFILGFFFRSTIAQQTKNNGR